MPTSAKIRFVEVGLCIQILSVPPKYFRPALFHFQSVMRIPSIAMKGKPPFVCRVSVERFANRDSGPAVNAQLVLPNAIALDNLGNLYVTDNNDYVVREIDVTGKITTVVPPRPALQHLRPNGGLRRQFIHRRYRTLPRDEVSRFHAHSVRRYRNTR